MSPSSGADLCRVTVVGPHRRVDIVLPAYVPFAELFPTVLRYAGTDLANVGLARGGWVLQRLGQPPFHPGMTPQQVGLRDGEMVYLRPRLSQLPQLAFDDVADVIATGVNEQPDRWGPKAARGVALAAGAGALLAAAAALLLSGPPWALPSIAAAAVAVLLLVAAVAVSRAGGDPGAGAVIGYLALPYGFLAGLLGPARLAQLTHLGAQQLLAGFAALVLVAAIAGAAIADGLPVFFGVGGAALLGAIGAECLSQLWCPPWRRWPGRDDRRGRARADSADPCGHLPDGARYLAPRPTQRRRPAA